LEPREIVGLADALPLDVRRFAEELRTNVHRDRVRSDFMSGVHSGVNGTPTFFINGRRDDGPPDVPSLMGSLRAAVQGS
jgi:protein-disulfide isomerase